ncbi:MAG TPA: hypothetical protein VFL91_13830 [Thermomicrobiales bacterium]|nr:hypothetical protein [Thermomicrobiales bacterium]
MEQHPRPLGVLVFSHGNPDAAFLAAGLLRGQPAQIGTVQLQGVGDAVPAPEVGQVLAELHLDTGARVPPAVSEAPPAPVEVGLTICVPT